MGSCKKFWWSEPKCRTFVPSNTSSERSVGSWCKKIPHPCVSPVATSHTIDAPASTTTHVGQISTCSSYGTFGFSGETSVER